MLLFKDLQNEDETFTKTALEWAVENNDRLCTTEILHQEFECHKDDRKQGLACLRQQLNGDELLTWTIETFTMFYSKTWAESFMIPLLGLIPVFFSICTFVLDYYSDFELTYEYYKKAFINDTILNTYEFIEESPEICLSYNETHLLVPGDLLRKCANYWSRMQDLQTLPGIADFSENGFCSDIERTSVEYRTAFFANIMFISLPLVIFYIMASRELWDKLCALEHQYAQRYKGSEMISNFQCTMVRRGDKTYLVILSYCNIFALLGRF